MKNPFRLREDPEVKAAYEKAEREARLERAKKEGRKAGLQKPKSFVEKIGDFGNALAKDFDGGGFSLLGETKKRKRKRRKR